MTIDPDFQADETLYRRVAPTEYPITEATFQKLIPFPDCSVNRSKYSQPTDVLLPDHQNYGVLGFLVGSVPKELGEGDQHRQFVVEHHPVPNNYAHSEIRSYQVNGVLKEPAKTLRTCFRDELRKKAWLILEPSVTL